MMHRQRLCLVIALAAILTLSMPGFQSLAQSSTQSSLQLTVYADGSVGVSYSVNETGTTTPGTIPDANFQVSFPASGGGSTVTITGSATLPPSITSQPPYNYSGAVSISGTYSEGVSQGAISIQAVPGLQSPFTSFKLNYNGNANSVSVSGNATLLYGIYQNGTSEENLNQSTIAHLLTVFNSEMNSTYLDSLLAELPYSNLTVSQYSQLSAQYGPESAMIHGNLVISGNITAMPAALAALYVFSSTGQQSGTCEQQQGCSVFYSAFAAIFSSIQSYSYTATYSNDNFGLQATLQASQNFNIEKALQILEAPSNSTVTFSSLYEKILNSTGFSLSGFTGKFSDNQQTSGDYTEAFQESGLTISPPYVRTGSMLNMSSFFELFNGTGTFPGTVTMVGGSNSAGTVSLVIPSGVPPPESSTSHSASWTSVQFSQLEGVEFTVGGAISTTTTSSSSSSQTTSSSSSSQTTSSSSSSQTTSSTTSSGAIPEFPVQLGIALLVTVVIVASYVVARRITIPRL